MLQIYTIPVLCLFRLKMALRRHPNNSTSCVKVSGCWLEVRKYFYACGKIIVVHRWKHVCLPFSFLFDIWHNCNYFWIWKSVLLVLQSIWFVLYIAAFIYHCLQQETRVVFYVRHYQMCPVVQSGYNTTESLNLFCVTFLVWKSVQWNSLHLRL